MRTKILSLATAGAIVLALSTPLYATKDSTNISTEQRIEKSAKELAAESIELATAAVKQAKENSNNVRAYVDERLNDTIINGKELKQRSNSYDYAEHYNNRVNNEWEMIDKSFSFAEKSMKGLTIFLITIICVIFLGIYLNRRQKYKIIEKAIENNYPLPPGFLGKNTKPTSTTIQHIHYTQEQVKSGKETVGSKKIIKEFNVTDWANFRSGIKWCAWGLAFMLFFIIEDASGWVFAIIPITIGAGKLYTAYQLQQADKNSKVYTENEKETTPPTFQGDKEDEE